MRSPVSGTGRVVVVAWTISCLLLISTPCAAEIYKYVDKDGVIHFTNLPTKPDFQKVRVGSSTITAGRSNYLKLASLNPSLRSPSAYACNPSFNLANQLAYEPYIKMSCKRHGLDQNLVKAVIRAESAFNPQAVFR